ncbi:hypothetical protein [Sagittula stellata]|uniref:hypothetical protein n=1 Tax=Sagittula stellata TaxID=52603 RepID=UPI0018DE7FDE|nr:hypothetical protein [Sagittula stellata]
MAATDRALYADGVHRRCLGKSGADPGGAANHDCPAALLSQVRLGAGGWMDFVLMQKILYFLP